MIENDHLLPRKNNFKIFCLWFRRQKRISHQKSYFLETSTIASILLLIINWIINKWFYFLVQIHRLHLCFIHDHSIAFFCYATFFHKKWHGVSWAINRGQVEPWLSYSLMYHYLLIPKTIGLNACRRLCFYLLNIIIRLLHCHTFIISKLIQIIGRSILLVYKL